jgi:heme-degrading monooxygenase HmoA
MHARVSRYSGDADALAAGFEAVTEELSRTDGFVQAYFLTDHEASRALSITLWESKEALDASATAAHRMRTRATEPSSATIDGVESFAVVLTASPG